MRHFNLCYIFMVLWAALPAAECLAQYHGGSNDGHALSVAVNQNPLSSIYTGGPNDGFQSFAAPAVLNPLTNIYTGGTDDGFALTATVNQNSLSNIYRGGTDDGFALTASLSQNALNNIYTGGPNDGFALALNTNQNPLNEIYRGGTNDGFALGLNTSQNPLSNIYMGGRDDGFAAMQITKQNPLEQPLPVTFLMFAGAWQGEDAVLEWKTAYERKLDHFELERSTDNGQHFVTAGTIRPWGGPNTESYYRFPDAKAALLPASIWLYRLKSVDESGEFRYSATVRLTRSKAEPVMILYPNPTGGTFVLELKGGTAEGYSCLLTTMNGAVLQKTRIVSATTTFDIGNQPPGQYVLNVMKDGAAVTQFKIVLIR